MTGCQSKRLNCEPVNYFKVSNLNASNPQRMLTNQEKLLDITKLHTATTPTINKLIN